MAKYLTDVGTYLFFQAASSQVFSAQASLTAVFGMGTGVPSPPLAPTISDLSVFENPFGTFTN